MQMEKINFLEGLARPVRKSQNLQEQGSQENKKRSSKIASCHICGKKYKNKYIMFCHLKQIHDMNPHVCKYCNESFINLKTMREHIEDEHLKYKQTSSYNQLESSLKRLMNTEILQTKGSLQEEFKQNFSKQQQPKKTGGVEREEMTKQNEVEGISPTRKKKSSQQKQTLQQQITKVQCINSEMMSSYCTQQEISSDQINQSQTQTQQIAKKQLKINEKQQKQQYKNSSELNILLDELMQDENENNSNFKQELNLNFFFENIESKNEENLEIETTNSISDQGSKSFKPKILQFQGQKLL